MSWKVMFSEKHGYSEYLIVDTPCYPCRYCVAVINSGPGHTYPSRCLQDRNRQYFETQDEAVDALAKRMEGDTNGKGE